MSDNNTVFGRQTESGKHRRSSFFQRRISLGDINGLADSTQIEPNESTDNNEEIKLAHYLEKLKKEREDWKKLLRNTEKENYSLKEKCSQVVDNRNYLTAEDRQFLEERPDYVSVGRLLDRAVEAVALRKQLVANSRRKLQSLSSDQSDSLREATAALIHSAINSCNELDLIYE